MPLYRDEALAIWGVVDGGPDELYKRGGPTKNSRTRYAKVLRLLREGVTDEQIRQKIKEWSLRHIGTVRKWYVSYEFQQHPLNDSASFDHDFEHTRDYHLMNILRDVHEMPSHLAFLPPHSLDIANLSSGQLPRWDGEPLLWEVAGGKYRRNLPVQFGDAIEHLESSAQGMIAQMLEKWSDLGGLLIQQCYELRSKIRENLGRETGLAATWELADDTEMGLKYDFWRTVYSWSVYPWAIDSTYTYEYFTDRSRDQLSLLRLKGQIKRAAANAWAVGGLPEPPGLPANLAWVLPEEAAPIRAKHLSLITHYRHSQEAATIRRAFAQMSKVCKELEPLLVGFSKEGLQTTWCNRCPKRTAM